MASVVLATKNRQKNIPVFKLLKKILADRKMIKEHLAKGGTLERLKEKDFQFATL